VQKQKKLAADPPGKTSRRVQKRKQKRSGNGLKGAVAFPWYAKTKRTEGGGPVWGGVVGKRETRQEERRGGGSRTQSFKPESTSDTTLAERSSKEEPEKKVREMRRGGQARH